MIGELHRFQHGPPAGFLLFVELLRVGDNMAEIQPVGGQFQMPGAEHVGQLQPPGRFVIGWQFGNRPFQLVGGNRLEGRDPGEALGEFVREGALRGIEQFGQPAGGDDRRRGQGDALGFHLLHEGLQQPAARSPAGDHHDRIRQIPRTARKLPQAATVLQPARPGETSREKRGGSAPWYFTRGSHTAIEWDIRCIYDSRLAYRWKRGQPQLNIAPTVTRLVNTPPYCLRAIIQR